MLFILVIARKTVSDIDSGVAKQTYEFVSSFHKVRELDVEYRWERLSRYERWTCRTVARAVEWSVLVMVFLS